MTKQDVDDSRAEAQRTFTNNKQQCMKGSRPQCNQPECCYVFGSAETNKDGEQFALCGPLTPPSNRAKDCVSGKEIDDAVDLLLKKGCKDPSATTNQKIGGKVYFRDGLSLQI